jgi:hypothetical protein
LNATGYSVDAYIDYYIDILTYAANAMPYSRIFFTFNFIPNEPGLTGAHANYAIEQILAGVEGLNAVVFGGPDALAESGAAGGTGLVGEAFPFYGTANFTLVDRRPDNTVHNVTCHGYKNRIPAAIQVSPPCYGMQWDADPLPARYWTLEELYQWMKNTASHKGNALNASYVFWYNVNGSAGTAMDNLGAPFNGYKGGAGYLTPTGQDIISTHHLIHNYTGPK